MTTPTRTLPTTADVIRNANRILARRAESEAFDLTDPYARWHAFGAEQRAYVDLFAHVSVYAQGPRTVIARVSGGNRHARKLHGGGIVGALFDDIDAGDAAMVTVEGWVATFTW